MIKLEVSGDTPQRFVEEAFNALGLIARAVQPRQAPQSAPVVTPAPATAPQLDAQTSPLTGEPTKDVRKTRTTKPKANKVAATDPVPEADAPVDGTLDSSVDFLADLGDEPPKAEAPVTLEDVRAAVRAYNAAVAKRGQTLEQGVAKVTPLFQKWNVTKVSDLKETQYAAFKAELQPYIDGTA
jgi:hypothetical protein